MKRTFLTVMVLALGLSIAAPAFAQDTIFDKTSDWFATVGKDKDEKDMILAQRRAGRAARRLSDGVEKGARKAGKSLKEMGKDMERSLD